MFNYRRIKLMLQGEDAECGLACLSMIAGFYGKSVSLALLRRYFRVSLKSSTILQLKLIAEEMGLAAQCLRIDLEQIVSLKLPCILHWELNHFVVLSKVTQKYLIIFDPARGKRNISWEELDGRFTGIAIELSVTRDFFIFHLEGSREESINFKTYYHYKKQFVYFLIVSIVIQLSYIVSIKLAQKVMDLSVHHAHKNVLLFFLLLLLSIKVVEIGVVGLRDLAQKSVQAHKVKKYSSVLLNHLFSLPLVYFEHRRKSTLVARMNIVLNLQRNTIQSVAEALIESVVMCLVLVIMWNIHVMLTLIMVASSLMYVMVKLYWDSQAQVYSQEIEYARKAELTYLIEILQLITAVKILSKSTKQLQVLSAYCIKKINATNRLALHNILFDSIKSFIYGIDYIVVIGLGGLYVSQFSLSVGGLFALLGFRQQWLASLVSLMNKWQSHKLYKLDWAKLDDLVREPSEFFNDEDSVFKMESLELIDVSYFYHGEKDPVFQHINYKITSGEHVVIKGPSGCGKTTLLKMMMGLLSPSSGNVYIDGVPLYPSSMQAFRNNIAAVFADDALFSGSIFDNIRFFDDIFDCERVYLSAKCAGIYDEIMAFPSGFNTLLGELGMGLSTGQKQRVLIARALYVRPAILFLDEATSHLDGCKEQEVLDNIRSLGVTVIMIAHRLVAVRLTDRVFDLSKAHI